MAILKIVLQLSKKLITEQVENLWAQCTWLFSFSDYSGIFVFVFHAIF